jgi:hypothetical protein
VIDNTFSNLEHGNRRTVLKIKDKPRHIECRSLEGIGLEGTRLSPGIPDSSVSCDVYAKVLRAIGDV